MRRWAGNATDLYQKWQGQTRRDEREGDEEDHEVARALPFARGLPEYKGAYGAPEHWTQNPEHRTIDSQQCVPEALRSKDSSAERKGGGEGGIKGEQKVGEGEEWTEPIRADRDQSQLLQDVVN